jgi:hypothetical protein
MIRKTVSTIAENRTDGEEDEKRTNKDATTNSRK